MTHDKKKKLVIASKPYLMKDGKPTLLTFALLRTRSGQRMICSMFNVYISSKNSNRYCGYKLDLDINIEDYRVCGVTSLVSRLRKAGM